MFFQVCTRSENANRGLPDGSMGLVSMKVDEGLTGYVIKKGEPVMAIDALTHPRFKYFPETGEERYHSFLGIPIFDKREPVGVLVAQTERRRRFTRDEVRLLKAVAVLVGGVLAQLRLLQSIEMQEEQQREYQDRMRAVVDDLRRRTGRKKGKTFRRSIRLGGVPAAPGFGIGKAHVLAPVVSFSQLPPRPLHSKEEEVARFLQVRERAAREVEKLKQKVRSTVPEFDAEVFDAHRLMLMDEGLVRSQEYMSKQYPGEELVLWNSAFGLDWSEDL